MRRRLVSISVAALLVTAVLALFISSCTQNQTQRQVSSFELANKVDFVCIQIFEQASAGTLSAIPPRPVPLSNCPPSPVGLTGEFSRYHLYALVTQLARGEVAVVDLSGQAVIDIDRATPGINFLPVGAQPSDIAVSPDGKISYVLAAEANKYAIYAITNRDILGDWLQNYGLFPENTRPVPKLTTWPVCALPQRPFGLTVVPRAASADAGGGAPSESDYQVAVVLPGEGKRPSQVITLDPKPFLRGADPAGTPDDQKLEISPGPRIEPGSLADCKIAITGAMDLSGDLPSSWTAGPSWGNGVPKDAAGTGAAGGATTGSEAGGPGVGTTAALSVPLPSTPGCVAPAPAGDAGTTDAGGADGGGADAGAPPSYPLAPTMKPPPQGTFVARDGQTLYVADGALPMIHVIDMSTPGSPRELAPLLATSQLTPDRLVSVAQIAVSPVTRDYKKYLYAVDKVDGSIMIYDVTDPATSPRVPLTRPNPELNPFQPPDRIAFGSPIATLSFARHDFSPRDRQGNILPAGYRGALCNPNPRASQDPSSPDFDPGTLFQVGGPGPGYNLSVGPLQLRGIFAFVTLSSGRMIVIDVDDWDSPCRRPYDLSKPISDTSFEQKGYPDGTAKDAYHVKIGGTSPTLPTVTDEYYWPMSAPHRSRSRDYIRNDSSTGLSRVPTVDGRPTLALNGASLPIGSNEGSSYPLMVPTKNNFPPFPPTTSPFDDATPGVRMSFEAPEVHFEQSWAVQYEGVLPGMEGYTGTLKRKDGNQSIELSQPNVLFCRKGVEDFRLGKQRAADIQKAQAAQEAIVGPAYPRNPLVSLPETRIADYVQITDEILDPADKYWDQDTNDDDGGNCWDTVSEDPNQTPHDARGRHDFCARVFGGYAGQQQPSLFRDFPILEAYDDHLVLGRFGYHDDKSITTSTREVVGRDRTNASFTSQLKCCFHNQVHFKVRTGGQWLTQSNFSPYAHHVVKDEATGACVFSCATRDQLLNSRAPAVASSPSKDRADPATFVSRDSPLAMRNATMSFVIYNGHRKATTEGPDFDALPDRDTLWQFTTRGGFTPLSYNLAGSTVAVSPQAMRFVEPFQQLAIVDGSSQGLILIDLNNFGLAHSPYF